LEDLNAGFCIWYRLDCELRLGGLLLLDDIWKHASCSA